MADSKKLNADIERIAALCLSGVEGLNVSADDDAGIAAFRLGWSFEDDATAAQLILEVAHLVERDGVAAAIAALRSADCQIEEAADGIA